MAEIKPFRAWRYNSKLSENIEDLCSPLFDVVSEKQRDKLYENPYNSIHLTLPRPGGHAEAKTLVDQWKKDGTLAQDPLPALYVYYQYFRLGGSNKEYCRKGFICNIRAYDWEDQEILRHENTIPRAVNSRVSLLNDTGLNTSPTHGLYSDPDHLLESFMDESILCPIYEAEDYQGVRDVVSMINDAKVIKRFIELIKTKKIILADGHHRYEGSLIFKKESIENNPDHHGNEGYNYHMMYLTNMESEDIRILPTHRLVSRIDGFNIQEFLPKIETYFTVREVENVYDINEIILGKKWAFGLIFKDSSYKIKLKPECIKEITHHYPKEVKELDLTILHFFIFEKILGIPVVQQRSTETIAYERNFTTCVSKVNNGQAQMAFITQEISIEDVKKVCFSGYTLPQKSTYFYPKVVSGYLFSSIKDNEFKIPACFGF